MNSFYYAAVIGLLWVVNLFNGTGLDNVYHVTQYARIFVITLATLKFTLLPGHRNRLIVTRKDLYSFAGVIILFTLSSLLASKGFQAIRYLWVYALIYLLAELPYDDKAFSLIGWAYGVGGLFILVVYEYTSVLRGWNPNSIAMVGMHSFLVFLIPLTKVKKKKQMILIVLITLVFAILSSKTGSRSCIIALLVAVAFVINIVPKKWLLKGNTRTTVLLVTPLVVAIIVVVISNTPLYSHLDAWSYQNFNKPIFNGRDSLWKFGFQKLGESILIGIGNQAYNWHNSAVHCLASFGVLGYILWLISLTNILERAYTWLKDDIVQGCFIGFIVLYLQQTVELGIISVTPNLIPYIMLGIMLGRIKYLRQKGEVQDA